MRSLYVLSIAGALLAAGCSSNSNDGGSPGGAPSTGAGGSGNPAGGSSGSTSNGGSNATGGSAAGGGGNSSLGGASGTGGAPASGGASGTGGVPGTGGAGTGGAADSGAEASGPTCTLPTAPEACALSVPRKTTLIDFTTYTATGTWGVSTSGDLTGGTSAFHGTGTADLTRVVEGQAPDTVLHVSGSIPVGSYAGFVLWFGPCVDASKVLDMDAALSTTGIDFSLGGSLGGARLKVQMQTHDDYPVDPANHKGGCLYSTCATQWTACMGPTLIVSTVAATPALVTVPWANFTGGLPVATTTGAGVVGLQFQVECVAGPSCAVDLRLGAVVLTL